MVHNLQWSTSKVLPLVYISSNLQWDTSMPENLECPEHALEPEDADFWVLPGLKPTAAAFDSSAVPAYCDHWVSNVVSRRGFLDTLEARTGGFWGRPLSRSAGNSEKLDPHLLSTFWVAPFIGNQAGHSVLRETCNNLDLAKPPSWKLQHHLCPFLA